MPTASIRSKAPRSPAAKSRLANHEADRATICDDQRLQISARTATDTSSSPTNRIMMVPMRAANAATESDRYCPAECFPSKISPKFQPPPRWRLPWSRLAAGKFKISSSQMKPPRSRIREAAAGQVLTSRERSAVAQPVGGAFPLRDIVGDHAGGFHRGLAELGIAGNLALNALAFGMQQVAQAFEFGDQVLDFRKRGSGDALDQRVDVVDGGLGARRRAARVSAARRPPDGADRRCRCGRSRGCRPRLPRPRRDCCRLPRLIRFFRNEW